MFLRLVLIDGAVESQNDNDSKQIESDKTVMEKAHRSQNNATCQPTPQPPSAGSQSRIACSSALARAIGNTITDSQGKTSCAP